MHVMRGCKHSILREAGASFGAADIRRQINEVAEAISHTRQQSSPHVHVINPHLTNVNARAPHFVMLYHNTTSTNNY